MHPLLAVDLTGIGTLILAAATACLAVLTRREVGNSDENIRIARDALLAQERPELAAAPEAPANAVGSQRTVSLSSYGKTTKLVGQVRVCLMEEGQVGLVSFELRNVGRGAAEIRRMRLMSLDSVREGGGPLYWEPNACDRVRRVVAPDETLPVDLTMTTDKPSWFHRHVRDQTKLWVEVAYADLAGPRGARPLVSDPGAARPDRRVVHGRGPARRARPRAEPPTRGRQGVCLGR